MLSPYPIRRISKQLRTVRIVDAAAEPVSIGDYKLYMRQGTLAIPQDVFDRKARAARRRVEQNLGQILVSQTFRATLDLPPGLEWTGGGAFGSVLARFAGYSPEPIELLYGPHRQVSGVYITDDNASVITVDPSQYWVSQVAQPARFALRQTAVWPDTLGRSFETFAIQYSSGYSIPFTVSGATLATLQPHGLVNGSVQRVWTNSDGQLPGGLSSGKDYYVVGATSLTLGLAEAPGGSPIAPTDPATGNSFLGEIPDDFIRAILAVMAADLSPDKKKTGRGTQGGSSLPDQARDFLSTERILNL